jgi:hypothetical protein
MGNPDTITSAVIQAGKYGGRGFIVAAGDSRYVITAAHCIFHRLPFPHSARYADEVTFKNLIGPLGGKRNIWAECVFIDPIADIAVFGASDVQDLHEQAAAYDALTERVAFKIGKLRFPHSRLPRAVSSEASMLSIDNEWFKCRITSWGRMLAFDQAERPVVGGMSGSPIVLPDGGVVGVVSCSAEYSTEPSASGKHGGPNPMLSANLPGWLLEEAAI